MTVLSEENILAQSSSAAPPRKKFCLSLASRSGDSRSKDWLFQTKNNSKEQLERDHQTSSDAASSRLAEHSHHSLKEYSLKKPIRPLKRTWDESTSGATRRHTHSKPRGVAMLNGYLSGHEGGAGSSAEDSPGGGGEASCGGGNTTPPIATLSNLGNTCFLNSVLYTLRFAPCFLHNLHHLVTRLAEQRLSHPTQTNALKCSSLGRNMSGPNSGSGKSWSSKDLLSLGRDSSSGSASGGTEGKSRIQLATERLHELYECLHNAEMREHHVGDQPYQPDVFLHALREVNPIFEGNQQHDAHELLVCLLDNIRETCRLVSVKPPSSSVSTSTTSSVTSNLLSNNNLPSCGSSASDSTDTSKSKNLRKSLKKRRSVLSWTTKSSSSGNSQGRILSNGTLSKSKEDLLQVNGGKPSSHQSNLAGIAEQNEDNSKSSNCSGNSSCSIATSENTSNSSVNSKPDFIAADFEGVSVLKTTCLECEHTTERKETFCDICVPLALLDQQQNDTSLNDSHDGKSSFSSRASQLYQAAIVTSEHLRDLNKYWCEQCLRYNEARRSIRYETLPRLLVLQLKRFSSTYGSMVCMSKVNDYMPTPLVLACFCEQCCQLEEKDRLHRYKLYAVIMHLGATMASGHYVAYVQASDHTRDYLNCTRDERKANSLSSATAAVVAAHAAAVGKSNNENKTMAGLLKFFRSKPASTNSNLSSNSSSNNSLMNQELKLNGNSLGSYYGRASSTCRSIDCCGIRVINSSEHNTISSASSSSSSTTEPCWLECDDETVRTLTRKEFEEVLAPKPSKTSALTPYLLFYAKCSPP